MASGPEHYKHAEGLLTTAEAMADLDDLMRQFLVQCAQVHATLALAAASAQNIRRNGQISPHATGLTEWNAVLGTEKSNG